MSTAKSLISENQLVPPTATVVHEPFGFVDLQACVASDADVVNAARVSFNRYVDELSEDDVKVLRFLIKNHHGTPFEHTYFKFHIRAPIFVFREWHRHRIASINEESARYIELRPDFYMPPPDRLRKQVDKPGRYKFEPITDEAEQEAVYQQFDDAYDHAYNAYDRMLKEGVAKEIARSVLPVGIYSQMIWSCNARSLMNFLYLRNADTALAEIRDYAKAIEDMFAKAMPETHKAFVDFERQAP